MNNPSAPDLATLARGPLSRRALLSTILVTPAVAAVVAACGDTTKGKGANPDTTTPHTTTPDTTTPDTATPDTATPDTATPDTATPDTTTPDTTGGTGIEHPTGANDVILRLGYVGGFVPTGYAFTSVPTTLISGDLRLITPGAVIDIYPGPLLPALDVQSITEAGVQKILALADKANLLAPPPAYEADVPVADVPDTRLELNAKGGSFVHQANALGYADPAETKVRLTLHDFCNSLGDMEALIGKENLGEVSPLVASSYRFQARPMSAEELAGYTDEPKPTMVKWPADLGVTLASAATCAEVDAAKIGTLFSDATQLTFFVEDGTTYMVAAVATLPGDTC